MQDDAFRSPRVRAAANGARNAAAGAQQPQPQQQQQQQQQVPLRVPQLCRGQLYNYVLRLTKSLVLQKGAATSCMVGREHSASQGLNNATSQEHSSAAECVWVDRILQGCF